MLMNKQENLVTMKIQKPYHLSNREKDKVLQKISRYCTKKPEIIAALSFGSFPEGQFRDIDIGLVLGRTFSPSAFYEQEIERELSNFINLPVDVRILNNAPVRFVYQVLRQQHIIFCKDPKAFAAFESDIIQEYLDYSYYLNQYRREVLGIS
jgi:predicted nucleotidyltransferase